MPPDQDLRILIADDEPLARQRLEDLLEKHRGVAVVGSADNGRAAVEAIRRLDPDLVFLDVQMPGLTGVEVVRTVGPAAMPATIFVTAYDRYALNAFELAAVDYLLKPFDDERFERAFERARRMIRIRKVDTLRRQLLELLQEQDAPDSAEKQPPQEATADGYLQRVAVELRGQVRVVPVESIDYITAGGPYAELHVGDDMFVIREQMQTLEERLDPDLFFRIHRSTIVRLDLIDALLHAAGGDYAVKLKNGTRLKVSRSRREELEQRLGLDTM